MELSSSAVPDGSSPSPYQTGRCDTPQASMGSVAEILQAAEEACVRTTTPLVLLAIAPCC